jgi:rubrerythrin
MGMMMPKTADEMAAESAREEAQMVWCDPDAPEEERTEHEKAFTGIILDSYPGKKVWVCKLCEFVGHDLVR